MADKKHDSQNSRKYSDRCKASKLIGVTSNNPEESDRHCYSEEQHTGSTIVAGCGDFFFDAIQEQRHHVVLTTQRLPDCAM